MFSHYECAESDGSTIAGWRRQLAAAAAAAAAAPAVVVAIEVDATVLIIKDHVARHDEGQTQHILAVLRENGPTTPTAVNQPAAENSQRTLSLSFR